MIESTKEGELSLFLAGFTLMLGIAQLARGQWEWGMFDLVMAVTFLYLWRLKR